MNHDIRIIHLLIFNSNLYQIFLHLLQTTFSCYCRKQSRSWARCLRREPSQDRDISLLHSFQGTHGTYSHISSFSIWLALFLVLACPMILLSLWANTCDSCLKAALPSFSSDKDHIGDLSFWNADGQACSTRDFCRFLLWAPSVHTLVDTTHCTHRDISKWWGRLVLLSISHIGSQAEILIRLDRKCCSIVLRSRDFSNFSIRQSKYLVRFLQRRKRWRDLSDSSRFGLHRS